jgi:hypothetical protein
MYMPFVIKDSIGARAISSKVDKEERLKHKRPSASIPLTIVDEEYIVPMHGRCGGRRDTIPQKSVSDKTYILNTCGFESHPVHSFINNHRFKEPVTINGIGQYLYYFITKGQPSIDRKDREEYDRKFG